MIDAVNKFIQCPICKSVQIELGVWRELNIDHVAEKEIIKCLCDSCAKNRREKIKITTTPKDLLAFTVNTYYIDKQEVKK